MSGAAAARTTVQTSESQMIAPLDPAPRQTARRILLLAAILVSLVSVPGCASTTVTRQALAERMGQSYPYSGSHFLYMGSKDGFDYVTHTGSSHRGSPGSQEFRLRTGELRVGQEMPFTPDRARWREIDIHAR